MTWTPGPDIPGAFRLTDSAVIGDRIYLPSGSRSGSRSLNMIGLDWASAGTRPRRRDDFGVAAAGERLYCLGGDAVNHCAR